MRFLTGYRHEQWRLVCLYHSTSWSVPWQQNRKKTQLKLFHYLIEITHYPNGHFEICFIMNAACF